MIEHRIDYLIPGELAPAPANPKRHDLAALRRSLERFGYAEPVLLDERTGQLVAGHGRVDALIAAEAAGLAPPSGIVVADGRWRMPVVRGWSSANDAEAAAYLVASNRLAEIGGWDDSELVGMLLHLNDGPGLDGIGYSPDDIEALLAATAPPPEKLTHPDVVPPPPDEPITQPGDLWLLGPHRLLCGDATVSDDYERVLNGEGASLGLTDPPYGIGIDYAGEWIDDEVFIGGLVEAFVPILRAHSDRVLISSGVGMMWLYPRPEWVLAWVEPAGVGRGPWGFTCTQPVLAYGSCPYLAAGLGSRPDTYIGKAQGSSSDEHPVAKPINVWKWILERGSVKANDLVLDPFMGSGTTIIAAHMTGRRAAGIEISPAYCDVICRRYEEHSGVVPIRESTGIPVSFARG